MSAFEELLAQYDYPLPKEQIALTPAEPRDSAQLLVYDRAHNHVSYSTFAHLAEFIPQNALLVFNDTKVIPVRLHARRSSGSMVEIFCFEIGAGNTCRALANRRLTRGEVLTIGDMHATVEDTRGHYVVSFDKPLNEILETYGETPIPPYLKHTPLSERELRDRYQSIFARHEGSSAAPTASLHFTDALLSRLRERGVEMVHVTLQVGLGTFAPLTEEALRTRALHPEPFSISAESAEKINRARTAGLPIIAVGTTAARAIESTADEHGVVLTQTGTTRLFITEGYRFKVLHGLITNFHVPRSSLLMLVAALVGHEKLFELYADAAAHHFRFLSFGDGMLIL